MGRLLPRADVRSVSFFLPLQVERMCASSSMLCWSHRGEIINATDNVATELKIVALFFHLR